MKQGNEKSIGTTPFTKRETNAILGHKSCGVAPMRGFDTGGR